MKSHPLKMERELRGWSQAKVAEAVGTNVRTVIRWEQGQSVPYPYFREKLCVLFGKSVIELGFLTQSNSEHPQEPQQNAALAAGPILDPAIPVVPRGWGGLVGREHLLARIEHLLVENQGVHAIALQGLPGVGKTALAVAVAALPAVRSSFHDGILWGGLGQKPDVLGFLARWGKVLGVSPTAVEDINSPASWGESLRMAIGQRRFLLVIDDAWSGEDALAFHIGGERCVHLLTSRLPHVAFAFAGDQTLGVSELSEDDGLTLLARSVPEVVEQQRESALALVRAVDGLPLALTLMGSYLAAQAFTGQARRLHDALTQLQNSERRLHISIPTAFGKRPPGLPAEMPLSLHSVIALSEQHLSKQAQTVLRSLSVFPPKPHTFSEEAALAVTADSLESLDELWDAGLLESSGAGRYMLHQTIVDYERMQGPETETLQRLVAYVVWYVQAHELDYEALEREQSIILKALEAAGQLEQSQALLQGIKSLVPFMRVRGHYTMADRLLLQAFRAALVQEEKREQLTVLRHRAFFAELRGEYVQAEHYSREGLRLARELSEPVEEESAFLAVLGLVAFHRGNYVQAKSLFERGLQLARELNNQEQICTLLIHLGGVFHFQGKFSLAEALYEEGLELAQRSEQLELLPPLLTYLGAVHCSRGRYQEAEHYYQEGLSLARSLGHREHLITILNNSGVLAFHRGDLAQAIAYYQEGLAVARQGGLRLSTSLLLANLGEVLVAQGNYSQAELFLQEGISSVRQMENRTHLLSLLIHLGSALGGQGRYEQADAVFQESLDLARVQNFPWFISKVLAKWGEVHLLARRWKAASAAFQEVLAYEHDANVDPMVLASAHYGLARIAAGNGKDAEAVELGQTSEALFARVGHYKAREVRDWLHAYSAAGV